MRKGKKKKPYRRQPSKGIEKILISIIANLKGDMQMLNTQELQEIKADINYFVNQFINQIAILQQDNDYLKRENEILKEQLKGEKSNDSR